MATTNAYSSTCMPLYDIHGNGFINQNYQVLVSDGSNNLSYYQPQIRLTAQPVPSPTNMLLYNTGMVVQPYTNTPFQIPASSPTATTAVPGLAYNSSASLQSQLTPGPSAVPFQKEVRKASLKHQAKGKRTTRNVTQVAKGGLLIGKPSKRRRGPNKRPAGTSFSHLLDGLPDDVKNALEAEYTGCCEAVNIKDTSTLQKHIFSNRHCQKLSKEHQQLVPTFVCPAFVAFKSGCKSKAGRYDSTDRHTKGCDGFYHIHKVNNGVSPIVITRAHYDVIQQYRMTHDESKWGKHGSDPAGEETYNRICAVLAEIFKDGFPNWYPADMFRDSNVSAIVDGSAPSPPSPPPPPPPIIPILEPLPIAHHFDQPSFCAPSPFNAEALSNESVEAFNGPPLITTSESVSTSIPVSNYLEPPSSHTSTSLFEPDTDHESTEANMNLDLFPLTNGDTEFDFSEIYAILDGTDESSTMSASVPEEDHFEQTPMYEPLVTDQNDTSQWDRLFAEFG